MGPKTKRQKLAISRHICEKGFASLEDREGVEIESFFNNIENSKIPN